MPTINKNNLDGSLYFLSNPDIRRTVNDLRQQIPKQMELLIEEIIKTEDKLEIAVSRLSVRGRDKERNPEVIDRIQSEIELTQKEILHLVGQLVACHRVVRPLKEMSASLHNIKFDTGAENDNS